MSSKKKQIQILIKSDYGESFPVPFRNFVANSEKFANDDHKEYQEKGIDFKDEFSYDALVQFFAAIDNKKPKISEQNAFEYDLLCRIWDVGENIKLFVDEYFKNCNKDLLIPKLIFLIKHQQDGKELINQLKEKLPHYVDDPILKELDYNVLLQVVNFKNYQSNNESFSKVFNFCLEYLDENRNEKDCSELFATINVTKISVEDQRELESRPYFDRSVLKDSLGKALSNIDVGLKEIIDYIAEKKSKKTNKNTNKANPPLFYPNYSQLNNPNNWTTLTAPNNLWIIPFGDAYNYGSPSYVQMKGKTFVIAGYSGNNYYGGSTITIPIRKDLNYTLSKGTATSGHQVYTIPFKTNNEIVCLPNYADTKPKNWHKENIAECNGWIYACSCGTSSVAQLRINSKSMYFSYSASGHCTYGSIFIPISKGDTYVASYYNDPDKLLFIPGKEGSETGFPDYDNEVRLNWNEQNTMTEPGWIYAKCVSYSCNSSNEKNSPAYLTVNGCTFIISQEHSGYQMVKSIFVPVSGGDKVCACGGYSNEYISFFPFVKEE